MTERQPTPWQDLVSDFKKRTAVAPEKQSEIWNQILDRVDPTDPHEAVPVSRWRRERLALVAGIVVGVIVGCVLAMTGVLG